MNTYRFYSEQFVDAEDEVEAQELFTPWDFVADAECEEITTSSLSEPAASAQETD